MSKLALGTVQFGLDYGISNASGRVSELEAKKILETAKSAGISLLDTAISYGDSETVLGGIGVGDFEVVTKLPALPNEIRNIEQWVDQHVDSSLGKLRIDSLYGLLLHKSGDFLMSYGSELHRSLLKLKEEGLVKKIGVSIYSPSELDALEHAKISIDLVQAPFNIFDRRMQTSGWLDKLEKKGIEMHARSVFLQGLLLLDSGNRGKFFDKWSRSFDNFESWVCATGQTKVSACLNFVNLFDSVNKIVVGVESQKHLIQLIDSIKSDQRVAQPNNLGSDDLTLINPMNWR